MIWTIAKKDFLLNLMTFKFAVGVVLCIVLMAVFMPVLVKDYQQRLKEYNENVAANEAKLRNAKVYFAIFHIGSNIYRPPAMLSVFSKGIEGHLDGSARIGPQNIPEINARLIAVNPYVSILPVWGVSLAFKIVVSALAFLVACDVISGERERETLKLMLSGNVTRSHVLLGKLLAGLMILLVPLTIAFLIGLLILTSSSMVDLTTSDWGHIGLMYLVSLIFISAICNIGLLVSCLTKRSAISLMLGVFFWIVFITVVPNVSVHLATRIRPLKPEDEVEGRIRLVEQEKKTELEEIPWAGQEVQSEGYSQWFVLVCDKERMDCRRKRFTMNTPVHLKYANKFWEVKHRHLGDLLKQKELADNLSRISPVFLYENVMSTLAGTDTASYQYFTARARAYRNEVIDYIRSKTDNFSSPIYFTQCTEADMAVYQEYLDGKMPEEDFQEWKEKKITQVLPLGLLDFPQFSYKHDAVKSLNRAIPDLLLLIFANVLFFALSFLAFVKYDVR
jgi:ABC-type transport system involved in multi-copper enzyme maturation permease subunit